nr:hypothetical protein [Kocuria marina]
MFSTMSVARDLRISQSSSATVRMDTPIRAVSGMTLGASPALIMPTLTTFMWSGATLRETIVFSATVTCAATNTGSTPFCGMDAWEP